MLNEFLAGIGHEPVAAKKNNQKLLVTTGDKCVTLPYFGTRCNWKI
jgi:hypothetical protein